jgi:hypothetical protein
VSRLFAANFYWLLSLQQGAELAGAMGRAVDAAALTALADAVSAAMVGALFHPAEGVWDAPLPGVGGSMNAQGMALAVGLGGAATANATPTIAAALVADAKAHGNRPTGGVASSRWVLEGFDAAGRADLALDMATTVTAPSWGYMVMEENMPGTIWEAWDGDATHSDGSKNHPMVRARHTPSLV